MRGLASDDTPMLCWGSVLSETSCSPGWQCRSRHCFLAKFCDACRSGPILVKQEFVRALTQEQSGIFMNRRSSGLWSSSSQCGGGLYRVANNTIGCIGPSIVIFSAPPPPELHFPGLPSGWASSDGHVHLFAARGTLVPTPTISRKTPLHPRNSVQVQHVDGENAPCNFTPLKRQRGDDEAYGDLATPRLHTEGDEAKLRTKGGGCVRSRCQQRSSSSISHRTSEEDHNPRGAIEEDHTPRGAIEEDHGPRGAIEEDHSPCGASENPRGASENPRGASENPRGAIGEDHNPCGASENPRGAIEEDHSPCGASENPRGASEEDHNPCGASENPRGASENPREASENLRGASVDERMIRNRVAAAKSRARKNAYVQDLQGKIRQLNATIETLRKENHRLVDIALADALNFALDGAIDVSLNELV